MQIDVKPLVWVDSAYSDMKTSGAYRVHVETYNMGLPFWSYGSMIMGRDASINALIAAANAHHAAQVRSQVAGVRLSDQEAYTLANAYGSDGIQSAIAAMQVQE